MEKLNCIIVRVQEQEIVERALNTFRVGLNKWDKTKVMEVNGELYVNYTIICTAETYNAIVNYSEAKREH